MRVDVHACRCRRLRALRPGAGLVLAVALVAGSVQAQTLASKAKESGCIDKPQAVDGAMYKCNTASGFAAYFNVPEGGTVDRAPPPKRATGPVAPASAAQAVPGLPRVDAATQKGRDDLRRKVLQDELAAEEKLLLESRTAFANGAPAALPEEKSDPQRYAERIARLRTAMLQHERNVELLRKELGLPR